MLLSVPIRSGSEKDDFVVTRSRRHRLRDTVLPSVVVSPSAHWFVVSDVTQFVLCKLHLPETYHILGTIFFRQTAMGSLVCCFVTPERSCSDFGQVSVASPEPNRFRDAHISEGGEIVYCSFMSPTEVVAVTYGACIGYLLLDGEEVVVTGKTIQLSGLSCVSTACLVEKLPLLVAATEKQVCVLVDVRQGIILNTVPECFPSELGAPVSCIAVPRSNSDVLDVLVSFSSGVEPYALTLRNMRCEIVVDDEGGWESNHYNYTMDTTGHLYCSCLGDFSLVAFVRQQTVLVVTLQEGQLQGKSIFGNETGVPYVSGFWVGKTFVVVRGDGLATLLLVELDPKDFSSLRVTPLRCIDLVFSCSAFLSDNSEDFLILAVKGIDALWLNDSEALRILDSNGQCHELRCRTLINAHSDAALVDAVFYRGGIALLTVERSGHCLATLMSASGVSTILLAKENDPESVSSCLLYERSANIFVTGHENGTLRVWISMELKHTIQTGHVGPVDRVAVFPCSGRRRDRDLISMCTERGSAVVHHAETFECMCVVQAPVGPLTSLLWDEATECVLAVAGNRGNLWHIPTCCLQLSFCTSECTADTPRRWNLMERSYEGGEIAVDKFSVCGVICLSIHIDVISVVNTLSRQSFVDLTPMNRFVLAILFGRSAKNRSHLTVLSESLSISTDWGNLPLNAVSGIQSVAYTLSASVISKMLHDLVGSLHQDDALLEEELNESLLGSGCIAEVPLPECIIPQAFPLLLRLAENARKAVRLAIRVTMAVLSPQRLGAVVDELLSKTSSKASVRRWFRLSQSILDVDVWCYNLLIRLTVASETSEVKRNGLPPFVVHGLRTEAQRLLKELSTEGGVQRILFVLLICREYYPYIAKHVLDDAEPVADAVAALAFEADGNVSASAVKTLLAIANTEGNRFMRIYLNKWYSNNAHWRPRLLTFLGNLIQVAPVLSYVAFSVMKQLFLRAYDPHNPRRVERDTCALPALRLIGLAITHLPNVSFHQQLQYLAFGGDDGVVQLINLKTTGIVASFVSHADAILCVSYSSNTLSHDVAVLSVKLDTVKVWRAMRPSGVFSTFFSSPTLNFRLAFVVDILPHTASNSELHNLQLLVTKCRVKWLSPHCVEVCTPFHDRIRLTIP